MQEAVITPDQARSGDWDVIVIGSGMGGSAAAHALTVAGARVLVVEKGLADVRESAAIGQEMHDPEARARIGRWPTRLSGRVDGREFDFFAPLGSGGGGSTLLYAAALDRFRPSDFGPRPHPDGGTLDWPISYAEFAPFYAKAEALLEVTGTPDPLAPPGTLPFDRPAPPEPGPRDAWLIARMTQAGLRPYRLHSAYRFVPGCGPCLGRTCLKDCRRDARNSLLIPAATTGRLALLGQAEALRLEADALRVTGLRVRVAGAEIPLTARSYVLAAGAYFSPALLLRSLGETWPQGLGNHRDQVGRHLMFHTGRSLALWAPRRLAAEGGAQKGGKSIVFRDFYDHAAGKFGEVQSTGAEARYGNILYALRLGLPTSRLRHLPGAWHLLRLPALLAAGLLGEAAIFELIMEDLPYAENRVRLEPGTPSGIRFDYRMSQELRDRFETYSAEVSRGLKGIRHLFLTHRPSLNHGHATGTCRIGRDPATSVADAQGFVHGLSNLAVADGSFMPTSGGTNPSLTIAAHGLRVGEILARRLAAGAL